MRAPPITFPVAAPKAEPDEKVANAKERARDGGNARTRMPIWEGYDDGVDQIGTRTKMRD